MSITAESPLRLNSKSGNSKNENSKRKLCACRSKMLRVKFFYSKTENREKLTKFLPSSLRSIMTN